MIGVHGLHIKNVETKFVIASKLIFCMANKFQITIPTVLYCGSVALNLVQCHFCIGDISLKLIKLQGCFVDKFYILCHLRKLNQKSI